MKACHYSQARVFSYDCRQDSSTDSESEDADAMLLAAASRMDVAAVTELLQCGASIHCASAEGETPLHLLLRAAVEYCYCGKSASVSVSIPQGTQTSTSSSQAGSAVQQGQDQLASSSKDEACLQAVVLLINHGSIVNVVDHEGVSALMVAASISSPLESAVVQLLCTAGANVALSDLAGETALMKAAANLWSTSISRLVSSGSDLNAQDALGQTALHHCLLNDCEYSDPIDIRAHVNLLIQLGADVNIQDDEGLNALHLAAMSASVPLDVVKLVISKIKDINATDDQGLTALLYALEEKEGEDGLDDLVDLLVSHHADVNHR